MATNEAAFAEKLKSVVLQRAADDDLILPALPDVVDLALARMAGQTFDPAALANVLEVDPLTVARIVRAANSAAFESGTPIITLTQALRRIGGRTLQAFLQASSSDAPADSRDPHINRICRQYQEHLVATGTVARDAVAMTLGDDHKEMADAAYLAGLLHDMGKPILAAMLLDAEIHLARQGVKTWLSAQAFLNLVASTHRTMGLLVAARWDMPGLVRVGIGDSKTFDRTEPRAISNFVRLANAISKRDGLHEGPVDAGEVARQIETGRQLLGLSEAQLGILSDDLAGRVRERTSLSRIS